MSEVEEGPPVCFACEFERRGFPCRNAQGKYQMDSVALALRDYYRLGDDRERRRRMIEPGNAHWAHECVAELVLESPQLALDFILRALPVFETKEDLAVLAAGPLEDLLDQHCASVIDRIEAEAERNERFRLLLSGVWGRNNVSTEAWQRLRRAVGEGPWLDRDPRTPQGSED